MAPESYTTRGAFQPHFRMKPIATFAPATAARLLAVLVPSDGSPEELGEAVSRGNPSSTHRTHV